MEFPLLKKGRILPIETCHNSAPGFRFFATTSCLPYERIDSNSTPFIDSMHPIKSHIINNDNNHHAHTQQIALSHNHYSTTTTITTTPHSSNAKRRLSNELYFPRTKPALSNNHQSNVNTQHSIERFISNAIQPTPYSTTPLSTEESSAESDCENDIDEFTPLSTPGEYSPIMSPLSDFDALNLEDTQTIGQISPINKETPECSPIVSPLSSPRSSLSDRSETSLPNSDTNNEEYE